MNSSYEEVSRRWEKRNAIRREKRRMEIIRNINSFMVGLMLILMIGIIGQWDVQEHISEGQAIALIISFIYIILYGVMTWNRLFKE